MLRHLTVLAALLVASTAFASETGHYTAGVVSKGTALGLNLGVAFPAERN